MQNDLDNRRPVEVMRKIACDMLAGREMKITFRTGKEYPIRGLNINAAPRSYLDQSFKLRLEYYDMEADELFDSYGEQIVVRSTDETKCYWRGFQTESHNL